MGSLEYREILAQIRNLKQLEIKKGQDFIRLKERVAQLGNVDYQMIKATIFRENFMKAINGSSNLEGYDLLMKKFNRIKNPEKFYELISKSDVFSDLFMYYKPR